jgi:CHAT domain-containing protein/tetratricopeptide (TPR) repeat protein
MRTAAVLLALAAISCVNTASRHRNSAQTAADATAAIRRGELDTARSLADQGLAETQSSPDSTWAWTFRLLRAETLILQLKTKEARADLVETIPQTLGLDSLRARQKYLQARAELSDGHLIAALAIVDDALTLPAAGDARLDLGVLAGQLRFRLGRPDADAILHNVVSEASEASDHYHEALALNNLGMARLSKSRYDDALPWFERVLGFSDLNRLSVYAAALSNAGTCYNQLGDFDRGIALQSKAVQMFEQHGATAQFVQALSELGRSLLLREDPAQALPYLRRALDVANSAGMSADAALIAGNLAWSYAHLQRWEEAERFNAEGIKLKEQLGTGRLVYNSMNSARIAEGRGDWARARTLYEGVIKSSPEPGIEWDANAGLARVARAGGQKRQATDHYERALQIIERTRSDLLKTDYKLSYLGSLIQFYREYVEALIDQGMIERALEVADSSRGRVLAERQRAPSPTRVTSAGFRSTARQSGRVLLFYWLQPQSSWLWVVTPIEIRLVKLPGGERIEALVQGHQSTIASPMADPMSGHATPGDDLYAALVAPAARWIPMGAKLLIVPDGALHSLNFETLPVDTPRRHYWIEDVEIQTVPSLGLLTTSLQRRAASRNADDSRQAPSLLLIGSPSVSDPKFPALRYASPEMTKVAAHFGPDRVVSYEGPRASPAAYRGASPERFSMIHFTAHAATNVESPLDSAVVLASDGGGYKLYARDIADQRDRPLRAELVTVSACRGAGERAYSGEGLIGFAWAFLRAGARRVIAGLWDVDDQSTVDLMDALYAGLARGEAPSRALRNAKLAMLHAGPFARPYYWGPFELFTVSP